MEVRVQRLYERPVEPAQFGGVLGRHQVVEVAFGSGQGTGSVCNPLLPFGELRLQLLVHRRQPYRLTPVHAGLHERDPTLEPGDGALGL